MGLRGVAKDMIDLSINIAFGSQINDGERVRGPSSIDETS
jgi:hypothetical protein